VEKDAASPTSTELTPTLRGCRLLLVEDDPDHRPLISTILSRAGADVVAVEHGEAAVNMLSAGADSKPRFDAILMDMQMPVLDGYAATRQLRLSGVTTPIVALTARALHTEREECFRAGCDAFLTKPIDWKNLAAELSSRINPPG